MTVQKIPVWLDCDPGHDDAVALLLALFHPNFHLVGVSTTYGNTSVKNTTHNTLGLLTTFNKLDVPVYVGAQAPLEKKPSYAPDIHGESGIDGTTEILEPVISSVNKLGDIDTLNKALYDAIKAHDDLSIIAIGPLTNMAVFFQSYPEAKSKVKRLSIMGGGLDGLQNRGSGEFNIWCDPKATNLIFGDSVLSQKTILCPLNVTHTVLFDEDVQKRLLNENKNTRIRRIIFDLMTFFKAAYAVHQQFISGPPVHDPVAVYVLLEEYGLLDIKSEYKKLKLNCIEHGQDEGKLEPKDDKDGVKVIFNIDVKKFWDTLLSAVEVSDSLQNA